ncbi:hypothetical protein SPSYN_00174 [Sporotomaculum syntrophicum]|uniref:Uncharacterized protein n=1 Tax=Sporotomaculum syntrophicum TaxID=182264 RepID=A0A9D3AX97_9FIRM|nr:hypothetical protein [Sporotomaculum syntrophicum]KAF1086455.1 hypothetical protein SPSYN_00174 [Sporotomaculum syntrophicum]
MDSFSKKRPSFDEFKVWFMDEVQRYTKTNYDNTYLPWTSIGSDETREDIVESFMQVLEKRFGFRPVIEERLSTMNGAIESVVIRIYHVFSTMFLVDHINEKMYGQRSKK